MLFYGIVNQNLNTPPTQNYDQKISKSVAKRTGSFCPSPWASGNSVAIQWQSSVPGTQTPVYTGMPLEKIFGSKCVSSVLPMALQWCSNLFPLCKSTLDRHWDTSGLYNQPVWFQWHPSVLAAPVVFQCVPIIQINTGSPLKHHWVLASASVVPVASQCTCGSIGLPV